MGLNELLRARQKVGKLNRELKNFDVLQHPVRRAGSTEEIDTVRQFLASTYRDRTIVSETMVNPETGTLQPGIEIGLDRSEFFYVPGTQQPIEVSARLIHTEPPDLIHSLQMHIDELPVESQHLIASLPLDQTVEFASLVKAKGVSTTVVMHLVRSMLQYSAEHDIEYWLWGMEEPIANSYHRMFGDIITRLGPPVGFGEFNFEHVPQLLNVRHGIDRFHHPKLIERAMGKAALFEFMRADGSDVTRPA